MKLLKKAMPKHGPPEVIVTDQLRSYGATLKEIASSAQQQTASRYMTVEAFANIDHEEIDPILSIKAA